jgi:hypothetical protein
MRHRVEQQPLHVVQDRGHEVPAAPYPSGFGRGCSSYVSVSARQVGSHLLACMHCCACSCYMDTVQAPSLGCGYAAWLLCGYVGSRWAWGSSCLPAISMGQYIPRGAVAAALIRSSCLPLVTQQLGGFCTAPCQVERAIDTQPRTDTATMIVQRRSGIACTQGAFQNVMYLQRPCGCCQRWHPACCR